MKKAFPVGLIVLVAAAVGLLTWWVLRIPPEDSGNTGTNAAEDRSATREDNDPARFQTEDFIPTFDTNGDEVVTFEEFDRVYGTPPFVFPRPDGSSNLSTQEAFELWDRDSSGSIDERDIERLKDKSWDRFAEEARKRGLHPKNFKGDFLALNAYQLAVWERERGAARRGDVPFGGRYFNGDYMQQWAELTLPDGQSTEGFVSEQHGKIWVLTPDAKLSVFDHDEVTVRDLGDDTLQMRYARAAKDTAFHDASANLALARKAMDWGLDGAARTLYARVLIFQPGNEEALDALGLHYNGRDHMKKDE